jgi:hypothetical protein
VLSQSAYVSSFRPQSYEKIMRYANTHTNA